jgi:hypothetical protein
MSAMQDPKIMALLQNNPMAQALQSAMMAHINEHLGFQYRIEIEKQLGVALPPKSDENGEEIGMDPAVEAKLAPMLAQAATQLLQMNQQQAAQKQAAQQAQDPLLQLQQQEVQIKQAEQQRKAAKDMADVELDKQKLALDAQKMMLDAKTAGDRQKFEALKAAASMRDSKEKALLDAGVDMLKDTYKTKKGD